MYITVPNNNIVERYYIINILFHEFLGLKYEICVANDEKDYTVILDNGRKLIIKDSFFNLFPTPLSYLSRKNIPTAITYADNSFLSMEKMPVLFGTGDLEMRDDSIICGSDLFAGAFFMLTRWEEYVVKERDVHGRFCSSNSLAFRFGFLNRAIVNEYTEYLWNMIYYLDSTAKRKKHSFEIIPTHDVDVISCWHTPFKDIKRIVSYFLKKGGIKYGMENIVSYIKTLVNKENDPYNTFRFLMEYSEGLGLKSYFFFMSSAEYFFAERDRMQKIADTILEKGHFVGFHPNKGTCSDRIVFQKELNALNTVLKRKNTIGRQHLLKFEVPFTWRIWNDCGMEWDSSLVYFDKIGFRCGVCYPFTVFDILERKHLQLKELPLLAMDCTLFHCNQLKPDDALSELSGIKSTVRKYNGKFVVLWHNSYFSFENRKTLAVYKEILKESYLDSAR